MSRAKKQPVYEYGILITKPWSKEMYEHNDAVLEVAIKNIRTVLNESYNSVKPTDIMSDDDNLYSIAKCICCYGWGNMTAEDIYKDASTELDNTAYYSARNMYIDLQKEGYVAPLEQGFIGYTN